MAVFDCWWSSVEWILQYIQTSKYAHVAHIKYIQTSKYAHKTHILHFPAPLKQLNAYKAHATLLDQQCHHTISADWPLGQYAATRQWAVSHVLAKQTMDTDGDTFLCYPPPIIMPSSVRAAPCMRVSVCLGGGGRKSGGLSWYSWHVRLWQTEFGMSGHRANAHASTQVIFFIFQMKSK